MKKSLNNIYKGKRLVTGDENDIDKHEILVKEENDQLVAIERNSNGELQQISGGSSSNAAQCAMYYYFTGSVSGVSGNNDVLVKKETGDLSLLMNVYMTATHLEKPETVLYGSSGSRGSAKVILKCNTFDTNDPVNSLSCKDSDGNYIKYTYEGSTLDGIIDIKVTKKNNNILCAPNIKYTDYNNNKDNNVALNLAYYNIPSNNEFVFKNINGSNRFEGVLYDIKNNILVYEVSSAVKFNIEPASLVDTLRVYGHNTKSLYINDKQRDPDKLPYTD